MRISSIFGLLTPAVCEMCGDELVEGEKAICSQCLAGITPTNEHLSPDSRLRHRLPRTAPIAVVGAFSAYTHEGGIGALIRRAKYNDRPDIVERLAAIYARQLIADGVLDGIDFIQGIPMHPVKRFFRGFNQTEEMARAFSRESGIPVVKVVSAAKRHSSQTHHGATGRAANVRGTFRLDRPELVEGRHIALVDDILTTGATISEVISTLLPANPAKISVFTLAATAGH